MASVFSTQSLQVGEQIGDYRLVRFIGAGGMGEVYEAEHLLLGTRQAIKFLRREHLCRPDILARFAQEARIASTLESRHIVKGCELRVAEGATPYMVMDLAEGQSLARILAQQGQLKASHALDLVHQACVGLCVAHERRIVHRDLKPDNLYVCSQDDGSELLKILDFGIAKHLGAGDSGVTTATGSNLGTAHYMSPEQAQGARHAIDQRTDIYSLGVILYESLSGSRPYQGESYNEILIRIVTQRPVPLDAFCPNLPRELVRIVDCAMQREPSARFQSASEFAAALARLVSSGVETTCFGLALKPATHPRGSDLGTLASPEDEVLGVLPLPHDKANMVAPLASEKSARRRANLRMPFLLALTAAASITVLVLWLHEASPVRRDPKAFGQSVRTALPASLSPSLVAHPTGQSTRIASVVPSNESTLSSALPTETMRSERPTRLVPAKTMSPSPRPKTMNQSTLIGTKAPREVPAIDEPLPPNPHAPGVSPVME